jgi:NADH-quinone oxidoreductase subunit A
MFIIFDLELVLIFPWAVTINLTGILGFSIFLFFIFVISLGFIYE